jgi:beta-glucosidase
MSRRAFKEAAVSRRKFLGASAAGLGAATGLVTAARAAAPPAAEGKPRAGAGPSPFPRDFGWGVATAAYQVEGGAAEDGRGPSIWDVFSKKDKAVFEGHTGDVACDHYHRFKDDVALMKRLGAKTYRFSVSWTRVMPEGAGTVNAKGLDFYSRLVDELHKAGIQPMATLYHWDFPQALYTRGGWLNRDSPKWFADYTAVVAGKLGDRVKSWATLNELASFIGMGHLDGVHAPGDKLKYSDYLTAAHNAMRAHGHAVKALRAAPAGGSFKVGYVVSAQLHKPARPDNADDVEAARYANFSVRDRSQWNNAWWTDPVVLGRYPEDALKLYGKDVPAALGRAADLEEMKQPIDFLGLNIYKAETWRMGEGGKPEQLPVPPGYPRAGLGWQTITPACMYWGPRHFHERYKLPLSITENGLSTRCQLFLDGKVHDPQRIDFMHRGLLELGRAIKDGVPVTGYYAWSLLDNFEWHDGYSQRFGMVYVDYQTQRRIPKDSFDWYRQVIATGGKSLYGKTAVPVTQVTDAG